MRVRCEDSQSSCIPSDAPGTFGRPGETRKSAGCHPPATTFVSPHRLRPLEQLMVSRIARHAIMGRQPNKVSHPHVRFFEDQGDTEP